MLLIKDKLELVQYIEDYMKKDVDEYEIWFEYDFHNPFFMDYTLEQYIRKCNESCKWLQQSFPELHCKLNKMENNQFLLTFTKHIN
jgi:hypothetical protein